MTVFMEKGDHTEETLRMAIGKAMELKCAIVVASNTGRTALGA